ncbi:hypothetical protein ACVWP4_004888, partial [Escherichia coli]
SVYECLIDHANTGVSIFVTLLPGIEGVNKATDVIEVSRYLHQLLSRPVILAGSCLLWPFYTQ